MGLTAFVSWLSVNRPTLKKDTIRQYLSAIRNVDVRMGYGDRGSLVKMAIQGHANLRATAVGPTALKPIWLSEWVLQSDCLLLEVMSTANPDIRVAQALATSIFGFLYASRATTLCAIRRSDLSVTRSTLTFIERQRKAKGEPELRSLSIPLGPCEPTRGLIKYIGAIPDPDCPLFTSLWPAASDSASVDSQLSKVRVLLDLPVSVALVDHQQAAHALRRGAAVALTSINVPAVRVHAWGGWSNESSMATYIDQREFNPPSEAAHRCFAWMGTDLVMPTFVKQPLPTSQSKVLVSPQKTIGKSPVPAAPKISSAVPIAITAEEPAVAVRASTRVKKQTVKFQ